MLLSAVLTSSRCVSMPFIFGPGTGGRIKAIILKQTNKQKLTKQAESKANKQMDKKPTEQIQVI